MTEGSGRQGFESAQTAPTDGAGEPPVTTWDQREEEHSDEAVTSSYRGGWRLLSHHGPQEAHHCLRLRMGSRIVALCARCFALYPMAVLVVALEAQFGRWAHDLRWFATTALLTPAVIDWSRARLFAVRGSNRVRMATGALAGLGLGLGFSDYLQRQNAQWFWLLLGVMAALVLLIWLNRRPMS